MKTKGSRRAVQLVNIVSGVGLIFFLFLGSNSSWAQSQFEVAGSYGYQFGGSIPSSVGPIKVADHANYGFTLDLTVYQRIQVELSYSRQDTRVALQPFLGTSTPLFNAAVEYYQIGALGEVVMGRLRPFALATVGIANMNPKAAGIDNTINAAFAVGGGTKVLLSPHFGLRFQGRLLFPIVSAGGGIFVGPGGGYIVASSRVLLRGDLSAGIFFAF